MPVILARGTGNQRSSGPALTVCGVGNQSLGYVRFCRKKTNKQASKKQNVWRKYGVARWGWGSGGGLDSREQTMEDGFQLVKELTTLSSNYGPHTKVGESWQSRVVLWLLRVRCGMPTYAHMSAHCMHTWMSYSHNNKCMKKEKKESSIAIRDCSLFWLRCTTELFPFVKCTVLCTQDNWEEGLVCVRWVPFCCDTSLGPQQGCGWGQKSSFNCGKW